MILLFKFLARKWREFTRMEFAWLVSERVFRGLARPRCAVRAAVVFACLAAVLFRAGSALAAPGWFSPVDIGSAGGAAFTRPEGCG
jgi:hypothetical protein